MKKSKAKKFKNFRFSEATISRLKKFARRKRLTQTAVVEYMIANFCLTKKEETDERP